MLETRQRGVDQNIFVEITTTFRRDPSGGVQVTHNRTEFGPGMHSHGDYQMTVLRRRRSFDADAKALLVERGVLARSPTPDAAGRI